MIYSGTRQLQSHTKFQTLRHALKGEETHSFLLKEQELRKIVESSAMTNEVLKQTVI